MEKRVRTSPHLSGIRPKLGTVLLAMLLAFPFPLHAQDYPNRPVRIVVPTGLSGLPDLVIRTVVPAMSKQLSQSVIVENRPSVGGIVGMEYVAKQVPPDGYTLLAGWSGLPRAPLTASLRFDVLKDLPAISVLAGGPTALVTAASAPFNTFPELLAYAKANPGKLNFGATADAVQWDAVTQKFGLNVVTIMYKSTPQLQQAVLTGEVQLSYAAVQRSIGDARAKKIKYLAVTSEKRLVEFPETPTFTDIGLPAIRGFWVSLHAPLGTPRMRMAAIHAAVDYALQQPEVKDFMAKNWMDIIGSSPAVADKYVTDEHDFYAALAKALNISPQ